MAKIDDVFGSVPASILNTWGQNFTYIKVATPKTYNPTTGAVTGGSLTDGTARLSSGALSLSLIHI